MQAALEILGHQAVVVEAQVRLVALLLEAVLATMAVSVFNRASQDHLYIMQEAAAVQVEALVDQVVAALRERLAWQELQTQAVAVAVAAMAVMVAQVL
jgi:hypothetical protein